MFAAVDVQYRPTGEARAALVLAASAAFAPIVGMPVIGVAKTPFASATQASPVVRGSSGATRPLYVTAAGMPAAEAAELVRSMAGRYRLPDALRRVDALARGHDTPASVTAADQR